MQIGFKFFWVKLPEIHKLRLFKKFFRTGSKLIRLELDNSNIFWVIRFKFKLRIAKITRVFLLHVFVTYIPVGQISIGTCEGSFPE